MSINSAYYESLLDSHKNGQLLPLSAVRMIGEDFRRANKSDDVYALARLFAAHFEPTVDNVATLVRFFDADVSDQSTHGAILGADYSWSFEAIDIEHLRRLTDTKMIAAKVTSLHSAFDALADLAINRLDAARILLQKYESVGISEFSNSFEKECYVDELERAIQRTNCQGEYLRLTSTERSKLPGLHEAAEMLRRRTDERTKDGGSR